MELKAKQDVAVSEEALQAWHRHSQACEGWNEGGIAEYWNDENGHLCIRYESGKWWHYKNIGTPEFTYWQVLILESEISFMKVYEKIKEMSIEEMQAFLSLLGADASYLYCVSVCKYRNDADEKNCGSEYCLSRDALAEVLNADYSLVEKEAREIYEIGTIR